MMNSDGTTLDFFPILKAFFPAGPLVDLICDSLVPILSYTLSLEDNSKLFRENLTGLPKVIPLMVF